MGAYSSATFPRRRLSETLKLQPADERQLYFSRPAWEEVFQIHQFEDMKLLDNENIKLLGLMKIQ